MSSQRPVIRSNGRMTTVRNHELIGSVNGSASFTATKYEVNPGLESLLAWLSSQAQKWEKYRWRKLCLHYVPSNAVTTTPGKVYLAADYDPMDSAPSTQAALSAYETQENGVVHKSLSLPISVERMFDGVQKKRVRCGPVGGDLQLYDGCSLIFATVNMSGSSAIGEIYLEYEVDLISPAIEPAVPVPPSLLYVTLGSDQSMSTGVADDVNFDTAVVEGFSLSEVDGAITLPCGQYMVEGQLRCVDTGNEVFTATANVYIDGVALSSPATFIAKTAASTTETLALPFMAFVRSDGSNVLTINSTLTGAAGSLTLSMAGTYMKIQAF